MTWPNLHGILLGAIELRESTAPLGRATSLYFHDTLLIVGVGVALLIILMTWAAFIRRKKKRHHHRRGGGRKVYRQRLGPKGSAPAEPEPGDSEDSGGDDEDSDQPRAGETEEEYERRRYKYRYKRRNHRGRNPSLAETGGLPPVRNDEPKGQP